MPERGVQGQYPVMTLPDFYEFYDRMVTDWLDKCNAVDEPYMPEPWWGWTPDSGARLHAVVINLNPGEGGIAQTRRCIRCKLGNCFSYRRAMSDRILAYILPSTASWHKTKREDPLLSALGNLPHEADTFSANTLSIELYPYHSKTFNNKIAKDYLESDNGRPLIRTLDFAATAACGSTLGNNVLLRISKSRWDYLVSTFTDLFDQPVNEYSVGDEGKSCAKAAVYTLKNSKHKDLSEIMRHTNFICIWNPKGRNNFPTRLDKLLGKIGIESDNTYINHLNDNQHE